MLTGWLFAALLTASPPQGVEVVQPTQAEQFASQLRLDARAQGPVVQGALDTANQEAAPIVQEMLQLRQELVNLALKGADMTEALQRYAEVAARMAGVETKAFAQIYESLRENQHERAPEAFRLMGGIFLPAATSAIGGGGGGGRGRGGD
jgi:hypothetical protein